MLMCHCSLCARHSQLEAKGYGTRQRRSLADAGRRVEHLAMAEAVSKEVAVAEEGRMQPAVKKLEMFAQRSGLRPT